MDIDLELQEKEIFREVIWEGNFEQIAIWTDGEWSVKDSIHYEHRSKEEQPIYVIQQSNIFDGDFSEERIDFLITQIENLLNSKKSLMITSKSIVPDDILTV
ncbi:hypothetical protein [Bacillus methanolicus]|uniref:Uncharacterized protein n=1 Tax=Bacillus methanolicus (strain MGA3 / ATCC 53907) TaxID=796606 RepID=I3E9E6_BACMM|nr:hypothetical protein [Bacillus methanolicus]AIE60366.1 hypothetical protein BMMGA3_09840 [Bacillus methanolicus MGA3]EIJ83117.1 hypothetical protein MGA3_07835 [Bacillus methanolicus MGA3]